MSCLKLILNLSAIVSVIIGFSQCQSPKSGNSIKEFEERFCNEDQETSPNLAFIPQGIDAIRDVLPEICKDLSIVDLCSVRSVCRALKEAADYEISKRSFEVHRVPIIREWDRVATEPLRNTLQIKPKLALFITNLNKPDIDYDAVSKLLMTQYLPELPKDCFLFHFTGVGVAIDDRTISVHWNDALGMFFHDTQRVKIRYSALNCEDFEDSNELQQTEHRFIEQSFPETSEKSGDFAYIFFNLQSEDSTNIYARKTLAALTQKYEKIPEKFALWGGNIGKMSSIYSENVLTLAFGASISGPGAASWSLVIDTEAEESLIVEKIENFNKSIHLTSKKSVALIMSTIPNEAEGWIELLRKQSNTLVIFQNFFPDLMLIQYYIAPNEKKYCIDSGIKHDRGGPLQFEYEDKYACFLIISYL